MTYQKSSLIRATDFDGFLTTTSNVYGVGSADRGYGQTTITQTAVNIGDLIRSVHWTNLRTMIVTCATHQNTAITNLPPSGVFGVGQHIVAHEQSAPSSNAYELSGYITAIDTNRLDVSNTSLSVATNVHSETRGASWSTNIVTEVSTVWASEDAARYYFNSGGQIRLTGSHPTGSTQDNHWHSTLATGVGTVKFAVHGTTNTGTINGSQAIGFYELTDSYQTIFTGAVAGSGSPYYYYYSGDNIVIQAKRLNHVGVHGGNGNGVQFRITLTDTGSYYSATTSAGTVFSFDNVKATTYLTGIASPTYATVTPF